MFLLITFIACSDEPPSFRVKNEYTSKANVLIKTTANTENINDVPPGTAKNYKEVTEGRVEVTAEIQGLPMNLQVYLKQNVIKTTLL